MTALKFAQKHHEAAHPCIVRGGLTPHLMVSCAHCEDDHHAALLSPCVGGHTDDRLILMTRCRSCGATGQLRFGKEAPWNPAPPAPPVTPGSVDIVRGGAGYVMVSCCDAAAVGVFVLRHAVTPTALVLHAAVQRCGHRFELVVRRTTDFSVEPHRHGPAVQLS